MLLFLAILFLIIALILGALCAFANDLYANGRKDDQEWGPFWWPFCISLALFAANYFWGGRPFTW